MKERKTANNGLFESNQLDADDCSRVSAILEKIKNENRVDEKSTGSDKVYLKLKE